MGDFKNQKLTNTDRLIQFERGLQHLPAINISVAGLKNGEGIYTDEAEIWKRILQYRLAQHIKPKYILETHPGKGIGRAFYSKASDNSQIIEINQLESTKDFVSSKNIIDIDPFGQPWDYIEKVKPLFGAKSYLMITNGEALAVRRNLIKAQRFPTKFYGKKMPIWVTNELLPKLKEITQMEVQFFYAFPTSIRVILSNQSLPKSLWNGCPQWMWWLPKYVNNV